MTQPVQPLPPPKARRKLTRFLLTGLAVLLPVVLTAYIVLLIYNFVDANLGSWLSRRLASALGEGEPNAAFRAGGNILAVGIVLLAALTAGALAASFIGRRIIGGLQQLMLKVPFVRAIYPYVKQVTDFFLTDSKLRYHTVVAVPYPRKGIYSLGFVTGRGMRSISEATGEDMVHVFIPSSPTPVTGYVIFLPRRDVIELPLTVDEALRFCISGGVLVPGRESNEPPRGTQDEDGDEAAETAAAEAPSSPTWATDE